MLFLQQSDLKFLYPGDIIIQRVANLKMKKYYDTLEEFQLKNEKKLPIKNIFTQVRDNEIWAITNISGSATTADKSCYGPSISTFFKIILRKIFFNVNSYWIEKHPNGKYK